MRVQSVGLALALCAALLVAPGGRLAAQNAASPPAAAPAPAPPPASPAVPPPAPMPSTPTPPLPPSSPPPASPPAVTNDVPPQKPASEDPGAGQAPGIPGDATVQTLEVPARTVAKLGGSATWEDGFKTIRTAIDTINAELAKAGIAPTGRPIANFIQVNDSNFKFEAMVPIAAAPEGKTDLGTGVRFGRSPGGKALKFQHRGAYDDIETTYDLITAFLDEKGLKAQDFFIEEYLSDLKDSEDQNLEVDIYIFLQ